MNSEEKLPHIEEARLKAELAALTGGEELVRMAFPLAGYPPLEAAIGERIRSAGPITFAEFMELALYHPEHGYYMREVRLGPEGDFVTSPEMHPAFGALVGRSIQWLWRVMKKPRPFALVEMGAGSGAFCHDLLTWAAAEAPEFSEALHYIIVDVSPLLVRAQKERLALASAAQRRVSWADWETGLRADSIVGCLISNELIDALPVHRVVMERGRLREIYVGLEQGSFTEVVGELSIPELRAYLEEVGVTLSEGQPAEINLAARDWMRRVAAALRRGFVLTIDHGYLAEELYNPAWPRENLICSYRQTHSDSPYVRVGHQDIAARVDFTALQQTGEAAGLRTVVYLTQEEFLLTLGLEQYQEALKTASLTPEERRRNREGMNALIDSARLGGCKVLLQRKRSARREQAWPPPEPAASPVLPLLPTSDRGYDRWQER